MRAENIPRNFDGLPRSRDEPYVESKNPDRKTVIALFVSAGNRAKRMICRQIRSAQLWEGTLNFWFTDDLQPNDIRDDPVPENEPEP